MMSHRLDSDSDSKDSIGTSFRGLGLRGLKGRGKSGMKTIKFGTNVDLSDERKWRAQLQERARQRKGCDTASSPQYSGHKGWHG